MNPKKILEEENPEALLWDGLEPGLVGVVRRACSPPLALYSASSCAAELEKTMGCEGAREFLEFNTFSAWLGESTPFYFYGDELNNDCRSALVELLFQLLEREMGQCSECSESNDCASEWCAAVRAARQAAKI